MTIWILEDDVSLGENLQKWLRERFEVEWVRSIAEFINLLGTGGRPDLVILDVNLPDGRGFSLTPRLRDLQIPFIFLTAEGDAESRLEGYELGAEEYIPKPFHLKELNLRIEHVLNSHRKTERLRLGSIEIDLQGLSIKHDSGAIEYPPVSDMKLLKALIERSPEPVSRDELMDKIWGQDSTPSLRTIDNAIVRIKKILGPEGESLRSVRGIGYQWTQKEDRHG